MPATIRKGSTGADVLRWQGLLNAAGFAAPQTSTFDDATDTATRAWQTAKGLAADGVVGQASWAAMTGEGAPKSFVEMLDLIEKNQRQPKGPFTPQLLMAIFWEESLFTNIAQTGGGTAIGFGQVEPAEMPKITTEKAKALGYYVEGVSASTRELSDELSVTVPSCYLLYLFHASNAANDAERVEFALRAYAGVYYQGPSPLTKERRLEIIAGWRRCEAMLRELPFTVKDVKRGASPDLESSYMAALSEARPFNAVNMHGRLFPTGWARNGDRSVPVAGAAALGGGLLLFGLGIGGLIAAEVIAPGTLAMAMRRFGSLLRRVRRS